MTTAHSETARRAVLRGTCVLAVALAVAGCGDFGEPAGPDPAPDDGGDGGDTLPPVIDALVPFRTFAGDTVVVEGRRFGAAPGSVLFTGVARADLEAAIVEWRTDRVRVLVPTGTASGPVRVRAGGRTSEGASFAPAAPVSFAGDVVPLFETFGCTACHANGANSGGLEVLPHAKLVANSAVVPRRSGSSRLRQRLLPTTPPSQRMPEGGPYLGDAQILVIADWIDQGARHN